MVKMIFGFILLSIAIGGLISAWQTANAVEKWNWIKGTMFASGCCVIAFSILFAFAYLF